MKYKLNARSSWILLSDSDVCQVVFRHCIEKYFSHANLYNLIHNHRSLITEARTVPVRSIKLIRTHVERFIPSLAGSFSLVSHTVSTDASVSI